MKIGFSINLSIERSNRAEKATRGAVGSFQRWGDGRARTRAGGRGTVGFVTPESESDL